MKYMKIVILAVILTFLSANNYVPKNLCNFVSGNLVLTEEDEGGITEKEFNDVLSEFEKVMSPIVKEKGYKLQINRKWTDDTINANTTTEGNKWVINAFGGLARFKGMDADAFMMVMCHELGHHLGGFPAQGWASNEGQSDYYATSKCYPRMTYSKNKSVSVPKIVSEKCSLQHKSQEEIEICEKGSMIGFTLATVLNDLSGSPKALNFETPDKNEVSKTNNAHPRAQCRLDTYFAGAVCGMPYTDEFSSDSPIPGACAEEKGDKIGVRPHCWYKPR
jgi:hypothetical protein